MAIFLRTGILHVCRQQPVEDMEDEEGENPVVEHGIPLPIAEGFGPGVGTTSNGLTPALPISTEPNGIPARGRPPGDAGDVAALVVELVPQAPDIAALPGSDVPARVPVPPPSKVVLEPDIPDDGLPMVKHVVPFPVIPIAAAAAGLSPRLARWHSELWRCRCRSPTRQRRNPRPARFQN
jgi:hypothetical protein